MTQLKKILLETAQIPHSCQYTARTRRGDYLVQIAWPLCWNEDRVPPKDDPPVSTIYVVDGNAYFFTAADISRRLEFTEDSRTVVVAIGYHNTECVYDIRREGDLTPPSKDGKYDVVYGLDGKPKPGDRYGGASDFLDVIEHDIMPFVERSLFPDAPMRTKALFGHSYGGIFTLNALFTRPTLFETFIAASPSIWFNHKSIVKWQEDEFRKRDADPVTPAPRVLLTWGSGEERLAKRARESEERFAWRVRVEGDKKMITYGRAMVARLQGCPSLRSVGKWEFEGEDHGSAAVCGLQKGLIKFLVEGD
ncbi:hypothetical protein QQZ08_002691 [Neonectria magnoliae]|uniref:Uncharacterized protein n=1 Tax=Neonectria magnoliae TaxID=2732573 RepID=A0ABR1IBL5_9HYPO